MKKINLLFFIFITSFSFSQQVLMKRNATQFNFLCLANGTSIDDVCGTNNFKEYHDGYYIAIEPPTITMGFSPQSSVTILNELIGTTNFNWINPGKQYTSTATTNPYPLAFVIKKVWADCNNDNFKDALYISIDFPTTVNDGSPIPIGTQISFSSGQLNSYITNTLLLESIQRWFQWDGVQWDGVQWDQYTYSYPLVTENWNSNVLSVKDFTKNYLVTIYPNPTNNSFTIQNERKSNERFRCTIIDLTGRIIKSEDSRFNEQINVEYLTRGNYFIQIETEDGQRYLKKLVKN